MLLEIEALSEIYDKKIFSYNLNKESGEIEGEFVAFNKFTDDNFITIIDNHNEFKVTYLPPIYLKFKVNINFENSKIYLCLNSPWLPKRSLKILDDMLVQIMHQNDESKLWLCCEFLENDAIKTITNSNSDCIKLNLNDIFPLETEAKIAGNLSMLLEFNDIRDESVFNNLIIECEVCMVMKRGNECSKFSVCSHIVCNVCILDHFNTRISIGCLNLSCAVCGEELDYLEVRRIIDPQSFERWDTLSFDSCLKSLDDYRACMRCQTFIAINLDDGYGFCKECRYTFCLDCKEIYNGPKCCHNKTEEDLLLNEQRDRNRIAHLKAPLPSFAEQKQYDQELFDYRIEKPKQYKKLSFEEKLQEMKGMAKGNVYLKWCPNCGMAYEKNGGCNHMTCPCCKHHFCFLCNTILPYPNIMGHFSGECKLFQIPK